MNLVERAVKRVDRFQQQHAWLAFPVAVVKKFGDDQGGSLGALIAYYGLLSLFPLLILLVSILGLVLSGNPELQQSIRDSALANFPVVGTAIGRNVEAIRGNVVTLAVGIGGTLWAGLAVTQAAQNAMNRVWSIPRRDWPNFVVKRLRGVLMLAVLGTITLGSTFTSGVGSSPAAFGLLRIAAVALSLLLNLALFLLTYQVLTAATLRWRDVFPGAVVAAVLWTALQSLGSFIVSQRISRAGDVYGTFALVIALLIWIYLGAQVLLMCAEINVVRNRRLWPRSLAPPPLTDGDEAAYRAMVHRVQMRPEQEVQVRFRGEERDPE
ncbi:MAG TPA: YihY/virulence factor BrkB family protein [Actinomycetota bacterium]|nr:YihY/virulence factor BrkB family protein [Actinomycetota bacterium]